jgi:hypothetical protein
MTNILNLMRKILLLLCIINITVSADAQLFGRHYEEGCYYGLDGVKHAGFVSWTAPQPSFLTGKGDRIYYKPEKKSDNLKIPSDQLKSFVLGADSFVVSKNELFEKKPFLSVLLNTNIKLYSSTVTKSSGSMMTMGPYGNMTMSGASFKYGKETYYYGPDPDNITKLEKKQFIDVMSRIMADNPEAVSRIKNKKLRYGDMKDLLYFYKHNVMPPAEVIDTF